MCQGWGKPEDRKITLRGFCALRKQHGRVICHHNCYVGSKRASLLGNKHFLASNKQKKSMKTLNWNIYGDQHSQLSGWAQLGLRRPELHFWQSHWSLSERGTRCFPALCINFLSCEMGPVIQISYKIHWWKIWRKNWYSLFFPTQTQAVMLFPNILSNKENTILFHECWYV